MPQAPPMAAKGPQATTHKRKRPPTGKHDGPATVKPPSNKKARILPGKKPPGMAAGGKPGGSAKAAMMNKKGKVVGGDEKKKKVEKGPPKSKKEARLHAKELAEARKKKRKPHYSLQQELASLWEKMRRRHIAKEERSKLISEALLKMKGKLQEIAGSHVSSRVLQTCVKYCSQPERDTVFEELRPHFLTLARNTYAVHLVKKMLDNASKQQLEGFISDLHGHVASLLCHMVGSVVVEHAFQLGNASQKRALLLELFSTELQLFKDLTNMTEGSVVDVISKLGLRKSSVVQHMSSVVQPVLEKGIVDHSIIHSLLMEYLSIADKTSAIDVLQQISGPLLVRMIHTRNGAKLGILCVKCGSAKERKKIIKDMKGHTGKIAHDQYGSLLKIQAPVDTGFLPGVEMHWRVLVSILSIVDDTKLITKVIIRELQAILKELCLDKNARRPLLQLLHPNSTRYFSPDDLVNLNLSVPSISAEDEMPESVANMELEKAAEDVEGCELPVKNDEDGSEGPHLMNGSKKDPSVRRYELLVDSGLGESLIDTCIENAGELLRSNFGREVLYEVATGGADSILQQPHGNKLKALHEAIASLAAQPKANDSDEEHLFENFHSSRTIRKLILDSPPFATRLWKLALEGRCETWALGHSCKVVSAFSESTDKEVKKLCKKELKPLIDRGILKAPGTKRAELVV